MLKTEPSACFFALIKNSLPYHPEVPSKFPTLNLLKATWAVIKPASAGFELGMKIAGKSIVESSSQVSLFGRKETLLLPLLIFMRRVSSFNLRSLKSLNSF
ncbi:hypothetical protein R83H12_02709 [Fibrobacteria bacterium R8-3-H12]